MSVKCKRNEAGGVGSPILMVLRASMAIDRNKRIDSSVLSVLGCKGLEQAGKPFTLYLKGDRAGQNPRTCCVRANIIGVDRELTRSSHK